MLTLYPSLKSIFNFGKKSLDIATRTKSYTGVPSRIDSKTGELMSDRFLSKYNGDIWTTSNLDAAKGYASGGLDQGKVFQIFGKTNKLAKMPNIPKNTEIMWSDMPFQFSRGKFRINPNAKIINSKDYGVTFNNKFGIPENKRIFGTNKILNHWKRPTLNNSIGTTTDDLFKIAKQNGYDGIKFKNIWDGGFETPEGIFVDLPYNEFVYKAGSDIIKTPLGVTKLDLIKSVPIDKTPIIQSGITLGLKHTMDDYGN